MSGNNIPWPEWCDAEVNAEKWGTVIAANPQKSKDKKEKKDKKGGKATPTPSGKDASRAAVEDTEVYDDPYEIPLPRSIRHKCSWVKPNDLFPDKRLVVYSASEINCPDLITANRSLYQSEFMRSLVSAVYNLVYLGKVKPFSIEWQTSNFQATTEGLPWMPWHHVYSACNVGKGQGHNPLVNSLGKYIVRLYWLGCWRKIIVDDRIPLSFSNAILLPLSTVQNDKEMEIWPIVLTKALLKIASLTWTDIDELVDFDIITCLTGWMVQKINTTGMDIIDVWEMCCSYSKHFTWSNSLLEKKKEEPPSEKKVEKEVEISKKDSAKTKSKASSKTSKNTKATKGEKSDENKQMNCYHIFLTCTDLRDLEENVIHDLTPCFEHALLIEETRNIPLIDKVPEYDRDIPLWKHFRWIDWAVLHGLWDRIEEWEICKFFRVVSAFRKQDDITQYDLELTFTERAISQSVSVIDEFVARKLEQTNNLGQSKSADKKGKKNKGSDKEKKTANKKEKSSDKKSKKGDTSPVGKKKQQFEDPSFWCNFSNLSAYVKQIEIYFKPSCFKINYLVSDIKMSGTIESKQKKPPGKGDKKKTAIEVNEDNIVRRIYWENILVKSRNEPIYLFSDSIDFKLSMFTLVHLGNEIPKVKPVEEKRPPKADCKKLFCKKHKCGEGCPCRMYSLSDIVSSYERFIDKRKKAHLIIEDFKWNSLQIGETPFFLNSYGTKSLLLDLEKGRHIKRLWIHANSPFMLLIFCDTELKVGKIDEILDCLVDESELLTQSCFNVCSSFANLIRYFGTEDYPEALRSFYKSYMPTVKLSKKQSELIHKRFQEELINLLSTVFGYEKYYIISRSFRVSLLNPSFRINTPSPSVSVLEDRDTIDMIEDSIVCICDDIDAQKLENKAAITIQAFFKMIYIKKLKALQNPYHKQFAAILDTLKQVYQAIFSTKSRTFALDLLRSLVLNNNDDNNYNNNNQKDNCTSIKNLLQYFSFYKDLNLVINLKCVSGEIAAADILNDIQQKSWVCLFRRKFSCLTNDPIIIRAYVVCNNLIEYQVRIFNNDTGDEMPYFANNALVASYRKNEAGYTVVAYGWLSSSSEIQPTYSKMLNWKMYLVIEKILASSCPVVLDNVKNFNSVLSGNYLPNLDNLICRVSIKINDRCNGTFMLQTSSPTVKIKLRCVSPENGDVLVEATGISFVLIPSVYLTDKSFDSDIDVKSNEAKDHTSGTELRSRELMSMKKDKKSVVKKKSVKSISDNRNHHLSIFKKKRKLTALFNQLIGNSKTPSFILEAFVLDNSWPLTAAEWTLVQTLRQKDYFDKDLSNDTETYLKKQQLSLSHKKSLNTSRRYSSIKVRSIDIDKPYWVLTTVNDTESNITVEVDTTRSTQIIEMKKNLFCDQERMKTAKKLRQEFLNSHYIKWSPELSQKEVEEDVLYEDFSCQHNAYFDPDVSIGAAAKLSYKSKSISSEKINYNNSDMQKNFCPECNLPPIDPSTFEFLKAPESIHKMLPPFEINKYDVAMDKFRWLVTEEDEAKIFKNVAINISNFEQDNSTFILSMTDYLDNYKRNQELLWNWYADIRKDSVYMMKQMELDREEVQRKLYELTGPTKDKTDKKGKKK